MRSLTTSPASAPSMSHRAATATRRRALGSIRMGAAPVVMAARLAQPGPSTRYRCGVEPHGPPTTYSVPPPPPHSLSLCVSCASPGCLSVRVRRPFTLCVLRRVCRMTVRQVLAVVSQPQAAADRLAMAAKKKVRMRAQHVQRKVPPPHSWSSSRRALVKVWYQTRRTEPRGSRPTSGCAKESGHGTSPSLMFCTCRASCGRVSMCLASDGTRRRPRRSGSRARILSSSLS
jgi:hypothetical protein